MSDPTTGRSPFSLLAQLAGDDDQLAIFSEQAAVESWLAAERALALAQAEHGVLSREDATAIATAARADAIDADALWATARTVGYPVLGLVRQIAAALPAGPDGRVHYGATTQDIMDTGLALQLHRSLAALDRRIGELGDALAARVEEHSRTVMAARTHAQQAVPTTFGATLATLLAQFTRHRERLAQAEPRVARIALFGAGGTSAALGPHAAAIRSTAAALLGLHDTTVPWHVERDGLAEFGWLCATISAACAKLARNVVDLSRTEIGEVGEPFSSHRGASSTMPQKVNPISSESIIGASAAAGALASSLLRIQEAGHERAAGEWQIEWQVLPQLAVLAGTAVSEAHLVVAGMRVDPERMAGNLAAGGGQIMAEAQMITLAPSMGRERAHDLVYEAAAAARRTGRTLAQTLPEIAQAHGRREPLPELPVVAEDYLGDAELTARTAVTTWNETAALARDDHPLPALALAADHTVRPRTGPPERLVADREGGAA